MPSPEGSSPGRRLTAYLALLGHPDLRVVPSQSDDGPRPVLMGPEVRLPDALDPELAWAAVAHAAAHHAHPREPWSGDPLKPVSRAIIGALEDARVELLTSARFPGLGRRWRAWHTATPADGGTFEALLARLGRALVDPAYDDPHPWVQKGLGFFFADDQRRALACPEGREADWRRIAGRLGHDIGQQRLPFNDRTFVVTPAYRDDHRWWWPPEVDPQPQEAPSPPDAGSTEDPPLPIAEDAVHRYPEWDHLISTLRPAWCTVRIRLAARGSVPEPPPGLAGRTARALGLAGVRVRRFRQAEGHDLDLAAVVDHALHRRLGLPPDDRVHQDVVRRRQPGALVLLVDASASTMGALAGGGTILGELLGMARLLGQTWQGPVVIRGFRSRGRHDVELVDLDAPGAVLDGLGSTRLGAAVRHATADLARLPGPRRLLILTDGRPHDIDVHDPRYLVEDARHALATARRRGVTAEALVLGDQGRAQARTLDHLFRRGSWSPLRRLGDLPGALVRLMA